MADKVIQVNVTSTKSQRVSVSPGNVQNEISATPDTSQYYSNLAKNWAIGAGLILNEDYSSKHYAKESANSASSAKNYADASQVTYTNVQNVANEALTDIETARVDAVDSITTVKSESIASVEAKGNEVASTVNEGIANINTAKTEAVNAVTSTKTTILNDIEFVADGEKEEIRDLADDIKESAKTVNTAIEAGVERLNSIDALKNNQITNCLLEVPQNIKLELNNGTLTLKAGSKVIVPNGFEADGTTPKFNEIILNHDKVVSPTGGSGTCLVSISSDGNSYSNASSTNNCVSGAGVTHKNYGLCYDTSTNIINRWGRDVVTFKSSLPFAQVTQTDGVITSVDQVFNGMGYIGSTIWVDKGVKGLIPNGRNEDGTLKNIEWTNDVVRVRNYANVNRSVIVALRHPQDIYYNDYPLSITETSAISQDEYMPSGSVSYLTEENIWRAHTGSDYYNMLWMPIGSFQTNASSVISNFQPKLAFRAVDYNDNNLPQADGQWVSKGLMPAENVELPIGDADFVYDLSNFLPNDNYNYEINLSCKINTGATSGSWVTASITSNGTQGQKAMWTRCLGVRSVTAAYNTQDANVRIPIGLDRSFTFKTNVGSKAGTLVKLYIEGYRRLGINL